MIQLSLIEVQSVPVEHVKNGLLHRNHGTWEERDFHGYRQTRYTGENWKFYVPWFSSFNSSRCSVSLFNGKCKDGVEIDSKDRIKIKGRWYDRSKWDH